MTAQRHNSAARPTDVAEQKLQDRRGANDLNAFRMLRPTERVTNRCRFLGTGSSDERVRHFVKERGRNSTNFLHHFGGVAREVAAQCLQNAARMLQGRIALRKTEAAIAVVGPALLIVGALLFIPAREKAGRSFFRVAKIFAQDARRIGEVNHVIAEEKIVFDNVSDDAAEKRSEERR